MDARVELGENRLKYVSRREREKERKRISVKPNLATERKREREKSIHFIHGKHY